MNDNENPKASLKGKIFRFLLGAVILAFALYIGRYWVKNKPRAKRKPPIKEVVLVEGVKAKVSNHRIIINAMGTVVPAQKLDLSSRVAGEVVRVSDEFFPGGYLKEGDLVVEIDKVDYNLLVEESALMVEKAELAIGQSDLAVEQDELAIKQSEYLIEQRKADIIKAEKDLALEKGQQKIAKSEFDVLGEKISENDQELVLRKPQLKAAVAAVESARSRLKEAENAKKQAEAKKRSTEDLKNTAIASKKQAELNIDKAKINLKRTEILAPFNSFIQAKKVEKGSQVGAGAPVVTIVDSNEFWVEVSVPVDRLKWIDIPDSKEEAGSRVRIYHEPAWGKKAFRTGTVKRLMSEIKAQDRMAKLLVSIEDPLSLNDVNKNKPKMMLGTYINAEIEGATISGVFSVARDVLRDRKKIWIMQDDNTLDIRVVEIIWSDNNSVYVSKGLKNDEFIITSDLSTPVQGMEIRLNGTPVEKSIEPITKSEESLKIGTESERHKGAE